MKKRKTKTKNLHPFPIFISRFNNFSNKYPLVVYVDRGFAQEKSIISPWPSRHFSCFSMLHRHNPEFFNSQNSLTFPNDFILQESNTSLVMNEYFKEGEKKQW